ncbi:transglutaminase-like cysteine peptidase [Poseidonibacter antarcticus]|uniref:transglutaminase-like cysteine peptidase n=1 Tax=Poseidonibacter antarcticus TaxID=2478538 RepID=UPI000EF4CE46|nr:transglutaminase-like cysteine peptidase [Poseidonibacter antarcticus]
MKIFIIILLLIFTSYSADFASSSLIKKVEKKYNRFAKNRFVALNRLLKRLQKSSTKKKLERVNEFFNFVKYKSDKEVYGISDYWASPSEFLARDKGDCEDYVIAKYFALKNLGIPTSKMFLTYVRVAGLKDAHMVLSYFETPNSEPLILDSIRRIIFPASKRTDLTPVYNFNPNILRNGKRTSAHKKWDVLLRKIKRNKI